MTKASAATSLAARFYAAALAIVAAALLYGGGLLASLGGSPYYLLAGLALAAAAVLIWRQRREGMWLYAGIVVATVAWAIWEVGFSGWALMPRLVAWLVLGTWMLTPWFRRSLRPVSAASPFARFAGWGGLAAGLVAAVALGALLHSMRPGVVDPRYQAGTTAFPMDRSASASAASAAEWQHWGGDRGGSRFSGLAQITPANVGSLKLAWRASVTRSAAGAAAGLEVTPLMVGDMLYACSGVNEVVALDAETGKVRWHVDTVAAQGRMCRGVAYYRVPGAAGPCAERILAATGNASLIALDARSGRRCPDFGENGAVDLLDGMSKSPAGYYFVTSAPAVVRGKVVLGGWVSDGQFWGEPSGVIRAFDAVTGKLAWAWDMGRPDRTGAPAPGETYTPATPNSWAPISADEALGLVYLPVGNATPDYFGAQRRSFDDKYSSSVVALDAETGRLRWSFQTLHHDLWDYDVASQPSLADITMPDGGTVPALLQLTKRGEVFLLDRRTGKPLHRVVEKPVPQAGKVPEERLSPTQPFSDAMPSFRNPDIRESDMWGITPLDQIWCRIKYREARYEGTLMPPGLTPAILSPGTVGGFNWGSASIDLDHGVMIANSTKVANYTRLLTRAAADARSLKPVGDNAPPVELAGPAPQIGTPYAAHTRSFLSPLGVPCQAPPYGFISAVDLATGKLIWSHPLGTARDSGPLGLRARAAIPLGTPTAGGSMTTRSGLVFIGATRDRTFRAFDVRTGKELWQVHLPRGAFATPMTYVGPKSRRQFVVVAVGGLPGLSLTGGAELMAFALPRRAALNRREADNEPP